MGRITLPCLEYLAVLASTELSASVENTDHVRYALAGNIYSIAMQQ